ncbi:hypothetical protein [Leptothermofonsia sp. ETS-13]|uniref:hypothetical protein n=1 Tax=Leptothermofonsia sp. ETS-13 TaxID=3035696 RepID=UPI003BA2293A
MSPLPDRFFQSSHPPLPKPLPSDEQLSAESDSTKGVPLNNSSDMDSNHPSENETASTRLVPKRPLMRPVNRPQPPTPPSTTSEKPPTTPPAVTLKAESTVSAGKVPSPTPSPTSKQLLAEQASMRQQPIPPPSEPKQYRAIGLLRGQYSPSEEQFTRGTLKTVDGTEIEAVLLGRVMSLVRNHLDLSEDHLWVVYPRTRESQENLHAQIVGVWEPEKLSKNKDQDGEGTAEESGEPAQTEAGGESLSPGYEDDYFSIRGEVVFYSAEEKQVAVKIQQAARKSSSKAKAFKLQLEGALDSPKTLGYFWDLHVKRVGTSLVITDGTAIGLVPPKKKTASGFKKERRPFKKKRDQRPGGGHKSSSGNSAPTRREPPPKPVKRNDQTNES